MAIKNIIILSVFAAMAILGGYKYYEYRTFEGLIKFYDSSLTQELLIVSKNNQFTTRISDLMDSDDTEDADGKSLSEVEEIDSFINAADTLIKELAFADNSRKDYISIVKRHRTELNSMRFKGWFLLGNRRNMYFSLINTHDQYYGNVLNVEDTVLIENTLITHLFQVLKDQALTQKFEAVTDLDNVESSFNENFELLAPLERYTQNNFEFKDAARIAEYFPYTTGKLNRYSDFLKSYYLVVKDVSGNDYESALYKLTKLEAARLEINVDVDTAFNENKDRNVEVNKATLNSLINEIKIINSYNTAHLGKYPFGRNIAFTTGNLLACNTYFVKTDFYKMVRDTDIKSVTFEELLSELEILEPQTKDTDAYFDKSLLTFENEGDEIIFTCKDGVSDTLYLYSILN